jgi:ABC-type multidrug transport system ATPase subunit
VAAEVRGDPERDARERLDLLGLGALAGRKMSTLAPEEARGVALAEALSSSARVLVLDEPFVALDPRAAVHLPGALRARGAASACVVFATASRRDATDLADSVLFVERGALVGHVAAASVRNARRVALRAIVSDARPLLAALAADAPFEAIEAESGAVVVRGGERAALAAAIARAALRAGVTLHALHTEDGGPPPRVAAPIARTPAPAPAPVLTTRSPAPKPEAT